MAPGLVQCMSIAGFIEDIRFGLGKIDNMATD
jgi:hypothetical protein